MENEKGRKGKVKGKKKRERKDGMVKGKIWMRWGNNGVKMHLKKLKIQIIFKGALPFSCAPPKPASRRVL